ncbi:MAG: FlgD immunoglobulin-like domain containing protein, partial [Candidatus Cloacimonadaceae bacterium]
FHNTVPDGFAGSFSATNIEEDPKLDANYQPIWTASIMSPCIDAGYGNSDPDGTPPDIGAIRAVDHRYWEYSFENQADADRWYWVSYPVLNTITDNALKASVFFEELLQVHKDSQDEYTPTYLDRIDWMIPQGLQNIAWSAQASNWSSNQHSHFVSSPQGYKIKLQLRNNPAFPWPVTLTESGFKTRDNLQFPIYGGVENWLGYFSDEARMPQDAFAAIWDDITMIKAKDWSLFRLPKPGNYWGMQGTVLPIKSGDMVIVTTNSNHSFRWGSGIPVPPRIKGTSESFIYDEKPDYIPVYLNIPDDMMMDLCEIGLYVDGVCKGAVVVDGPFEQVSAYVDSPDELSGGDVEFVFCYEEGKRAGNELRAMNLNPGRLQPQYGVAGASYPYFEIKITQDDMEEIVPPEFSLRQNYPNPFNPSTTISYWLPEMARVRLDIYNLKGQLVKTLIDSEMAAGPHSVVWNGKDSNDQAVASGVYFYRISSPNNTQTKRMLLMK